MRLSLKLERESDDFTPYQDDFKLIVENWGSLQSTSRMRKGFLKKFTPGERNTLQEFYVLFSRWCLRTGMPGVWYVSLKDLILIQRLAQFIAWGFNVDIIRLDQIRRSILNFIKSYGNMLGIPEACGEFNDLQREYITTYQKIYPNAVLGNMRGGKEVEYTQRGDVCNFGADYIISKEDAILKNMVADLDNKMGAKQLDCVHDRIYKLNGYTFNWT